MTGMLQDTADPVTGCPDQAVLRQYRQYTEIGHFLPFPACMKISVAASVPLGERFPC